MRVIPFSRFNATMARMAAAIAGGMPKFQAFEKYGASYKSRGKGKSRSQASPRFVAHGKRAAVKAKNRAKHRSHCK